ncbi:ATPase involved in chromosome partitioning [Mycolicibacterium fortuitum]|uniref:ATPase involved in chromosome partitioning n=1 Tax=Mycolicibacterium fortuitum TaxID=1766 RepID=A0A378WF81_MYCFO|nr:ATPase involved in chromosome partitioning [Mycolicibacterium fortuitum]
MSSDTGDQPANSTDDPTPPHAAQAATPQGGRRRAPDLNTAADQTLVIPTLDPQAGTASAPAAAAEPPAEDRLFTEPNGWPSRIDASDSLWQSHLFPPMPSAGLMPSAADYEITPAGRHASDQYPQPAPPDQPASTLQPVLPPPPPAPAPTVGISDGVLPSVVLATPPRAVLPPTQGWRRVLHSVAKINLGPSKDELYERDLHARIRRAARDSYQIGVLGLKGGAGRTTVTIALGSILSQIRGDRILSVDADPHAGNLGDRTPRQSEATVSELLSDPQLVRYNAIRSYTQMNTANLEVLASPDYSRMARPFNGNDWHRTVEAAAPYYNLILSDCGNSFFDDTTQAVLASGASIVVVASASFDGVKQAASALEWLRNNNYQDVLGRACLVINHVTREKPNIDMDVVVDQFGRHLAPHRVIELPWDKHIAHDPEIRLESLGHTYRRRITELAAALSEDFSIRHEPRR